MRMPAKKGSEEKAAWVCPEFIEAVVPDKDDLAQAFVYMQSGVTLKVRVDVGKVANEEINEVIGQAYKRQYDFDASFDDRYRRKEDVKQEDDSTREEV